MLRDADDGNRFSSSSSSGGSYVIAFVCRFSSRRRSCSGRFHILGRDSQWRRWRFCRVEMNCRRVDSARWWWWRRRGCCIQIAVVVQWRQVIGDDVFVAILAATFFTRRVNFWNSILKGKISILGTNKQTVETLSDASETIAASQINK